MSDTFEKLERAKRKQRQRKDLERFESGLAGQAGLAAPVRLHPLDDALAIQSKLYPRLRELREKGELSVDDSLSREQFVSAIQRVLSPLRDTKLLVYLCRWEHIGALELTGGELENSLLGILDFDGDTVTACDPGLSRIVSFDRLVESDGSVIYEADTWSKS